MFEVLFSTTAISGYALAVLLGLMAYKGAFKAAMSALDARAHGIQDQIDRVTELRHEAKQLHKEYQTDLAKAEQQRHNGQRQAKVDAQVYIDRQRAMIKNSVNAQLRIGKGRIEQEQRRAQMGASDALLDGAVSVAAQIIGNATSAQQSAINETSLKQIQLTLH